MKKLILPTFCFLYVVSLLSYCAPLEVYQITLRSSSSLMPADGKNKATLKAMALDSKGKELKKWSPKIQLYLDNKLHKEKTFQTKEPGTYRFVARMGHIKSNVVNIQATTAKEYVYHLMSRTYLWAEKIPKTKITDFKTPEEVVDKLAFRPERQGMDRWTSISDRVAYDNYYKGKYVGLGVRMSYDKKNQLRMALVYEDSPAYNVGIRRGMQVKSVNGVSVKQIEDEKRWDTIFGKNEKGVEVVFELEYNGTVKEYRAAKSSVQLRSVFAASFHKIAEKQVGYLYFDRFISPSEDELKTEFSRLKKENIDELVLDMRYNGGGLLRVATLLGSLIAGKKGKDKIFYKNDHNQQLKSWNNDSRFQPNDNAIDIKRVFIIASGSTASASEVVINGLRPLMPVVVIGTKTYGKPVGAYNFTFFNKVISLISFRIVNDAGEGDYFQGIKPDIPAEDDITQNLGNPKETSFKAALQAISTNNLPLLPTRSSTPQTPHKRIPWTGIQQIIQAF